MITSRCPDNWRALQCEVAGILDECGFAVTVEKTIHLARGQAVVDVHAEEDARGRPYTIFCECKLWSSPIPQHVVHAFRSILADGGANVGYVITSSRFQPGAAAAAQLTNVRLTTWEEFQTEFEATWIDNHLLRVVSERLDPLLTYLEPILPRAFDELDEAGKLAYIELRNRYAVLAGLIIPFTTIGKAMFGTVPDLPLRPALLRRPAQARYQTRSSTPWAIETCGMR